ncbi:MAG: DUF4097 family beta strand repeat-containing protein [Acidobacteriota bacterium]
MIRHLIARVVLMVVALGALLGAQTADNERIRVRIRDRVERAVPAVRIVAEQPDDDPCRDRGRDDEYYRHCEVRESTLPAGPLTVDATPNGGIRVEGSDRSDIRLVAVVTAHAREESAAKQLASGVQIQSGSGRVSASGPSTGRREWWSVSFRLYVPRRNDLDLTARNGGISVMTVEGRIRFDTTNGGVTLRDLGGDVSGRTRNGGLTVMLGGNRWNGTGLDVETTNGGVTLSIPKGYNADLTTGTVNGSFRTDVPMTVQGELSPRRGLSTTLGSGGPPVRVRTTNGGLRINPR